jgi:hypothetical protein
MWSAEVAVFEVAVFEVAVFEVAVFEVAAFEVCCGVMEHGYCGPKRSILIKTLIEID